MSDPVSRAMHFLQTGKDQLAVQEIQQAIASDPSNLEYQYVLGGIYNRLNRLEEAETIFQALLRTNPDRFQKCHFDLTTISLKRQDDAGALAHLEKAKAVDAGRAYYESGLIFMRRKQFDRAIEAFDQAVLLKPEITYECQVQKASAFVRLGDPKRSQEVLKELLAMDLPPDRREEAARMYEELDSTVRTERPWYLSANLGVQYDDNVFQQPLEQVNVTPSTQGTKDKSDVAYLATVFGKYDAWKNGPWKAGLSYLHYQMMYQKVTENNLLGARPALYLEYGKTPFFGAIEFAYTHYWVDQDPRVDIYALNPRLTWVHSDQFRSEIYGGVERRLYLDTTPDDLHGFVGFTEYWMMNKGMSHIRGGYLFDYDDFTPEERGDITGNRFSIGLNYPVYQDKCFMDIEGQYYLRHYQFDPNIDSDEKRSDDEFHVNVQVYGHLSKALDLRLGYFQTWNESNVLNSFGVDPYHFRRGVSLLMFTYTF